MAVDTGFAPNPFFGVLTLAACKPKIRLKKDVHDWIAGFTSKALCKDDVGKERLIYLMQITDKIKISEYFNHPHYQIKIPDPSNEETVYRAGDNIYKPCGMGFEQIENWNHDESNKDADISGDYVLISNKFYYFGGKPLEIDDSVRPKIPKGQSAHGALSDHLPARKFIDYILVNYKEGVHNAPHRWKSGDSSWNK